MAKDCIAEISLYPLQNGFYDVIGDFIKRIKAYHEFDISVMTTCSHVKGDYSRLFEVLGKELQQLHEEQGQAILVCKFLQGDDMTTGLHSGH